MVLSVSLVPGQDFDSCMSLQVHTQTWTSRSSLLHVSVGQVCQLCWAYSGVAVPAGPEGSLWATACCYPHHWTSQPNARNL